MNERALRPGQLTRPFPVGRCENEECQTPLDRDAYLYVDRINRRSLVVCDDCAAYFDSHDHERFVPGRA